jgi:hypothetical protein
MKPLRQGTNREEIAVQLKARREEPAMTDSLSQTSSEPFVPPATPAPESRGLARLYMTSDLRAATGLPRTHLDYYLREGLILPTARTESGYLLFDDRELATLRAIIADRQAGLGIREIRERLGR